MSFFSFFSFSFLYIAAPRTHVHYFVLYVFLLSFIDIIFLNMLPLLIDIFSHKVDNVKKPLL